MDLHTQLAERLFPFWIHSQNKTVRKVVVCIWNRSFKIFKLSLRISCCRNGLILSAANICPVCWKFKSADCLLNPCENSGANISLNSKIVGPSIMFRKTNIWSCLDIASLTMRKFLSEAVNICTKYFPTSSVRRFDWLSAWAIDALKIHSSFKYPPQ